MDDQDLEIEQNDELQKFLGTSTFGKATRESNAQQQLDRSRRPTAAKQEAEDSDSGANGKPQQDSDSDDDDSDDDEDDEDEFPVSHEMIMKTHDRAITCATVDSAGGRLVTGSMDCSLKFHDFGAMTPTTIRAFKSVDPNATKTSANVETHPVHQVLFNPLSANHILVATAFPQAKILSRDGESLV